MPHGVSVGPRDRSSVFVRYDAATRGAAQGATIGAIGATRDRAVNHARGWWHECARHVRTGVSCVPTPGGPGHCPHPSRLPAVRVGDRKAPGTRPPTRERPAALHAYRGESPAPPQSRSSWPAPGATSPCSRGVRVEPSGRCVTADRRPRTARRACRRPASDRSRSPRRRTTRCAGRAAPRWPSPSPGRPEARTRCRRPRA